MTDIHQHTMDPSPMPQTLPSVSLPVSVVADLQDALFMAMTDLNRLEGLLDHATANLLERFGAAEKALGHLAMDQNDDVGQIRLKLHQAVTELQFHDMATQLLGHTGKVLQGCAWRLAEEVMEPDEDEVPLASLNPMPDRPSPVAQNEMDAGSIELF
jgi:hypothetical protein